MLGEPHQICAEVRPEPTNNENQLLCRTNMLVCWSTQLRRETFPLHRKCCFGKEMYLSNANFSFFNVYWTKSDILKFGNVYFFLTTKSKEK